MGKRGFDFRFSVGGEVFILIEAGDVFRAIYEWIYRRPYGFSFVDEFVCGSARPLSRKAVSWLVQKQSVKSILSLTERPLPPHLVSYVEEYKHIPIENHKAPSFDQLRDAVNFLISCSALKRKTLVHCAAGKGRTGTVLAAYFCAKNGFDYNDAIREIRRRRGSGSVERGAQENAVKDYCERVRRQEDGETQYKTRNQ